MARIPIYQDPQQLRTGNQTLQTPNLPAVTNASIGKAIGDASNVIFDISEKAKRANDVTKLTEASLAMNKAQVDFATFQQENPDESKWLPKWQELQNGIKSRFDQEALSPDARLQLADRFSSWGTRGTIMVQSNAFKQAGQRMDATGEVAKQTAIDSGDVSIYEDHVKGEVAAGFTLPEVATLKVAETKKLAKQKRIADLNAQVPILTQAVNNGDKSAIEKLAKVNDELGELGGKSTEESGLYNDIIINGAKAQQEVSELKVIANDDPKMAAELAIEKERAGKINGRDRVDIERDAYQSMAFKRRDAINKYKERLALHDVPSADELKSDVWLTDYDRVAIIDAATGSTNDPADFESALTAAMTFDPSQFGDEREALTEATNMEASFETRFEGPYLATLKAELTKRQNRAMDAATEATDLGPALKMLDEEIEAGALGPVTKPVLQDGKPVMRDPKKEGFIQSPGWLWGTNKKDVQENDGKPVPLTETDAVAREKAAAAQRDIRRILESEVKSEKLKDQAAITARAIELFKMKGGKMTPRPEVNDSIDPTLMIDKVSPEQQKKDIEELLKKYGH